MGRTDSRGRLLLLLAVMLVLSTGMGMRLAYWQVTQRDQLSAISGKESYSQRYLPAKRGTIYDRTGTIVLAETVYEYRIVGDLHDLTEADRKKDADELVDYLGLDPTDEASLRTAMEGHGYYVVLRRNIDAETAQEITTAQVNGSMTTLTLEPTPVRVYPQTGGAPNTSLAAQILGFVNDSGVGQYGLEQQYDKILAGKPEVVSIDPNTPGPLGEHIIDLGVAGQDIRTTIDASLQLQVEQEVFSAWLADKARAVSASAMDPKTGAILAEATYPSYDANHYSQVAMQDPTRFRDPMISEVYEPGSVFKMLTASAALQTKTTALNTSLDDIGVMKLPGGQEVADADRKAKGWMSFADIVAWSRNVGVSKAAFRLGKNTASASATLFKTWQEYNIGQPTGIDLAGEVAGIVRNPAKAPWAQIDLANASFGQGVAVTPMQLMRAYAVMENGGVSVTPHVADQTYSGSATTTGSRSVVTLAPAVGGRVIAADLSGSLTDLMQHVVRAVPSYNQATYIAHYYVGGKTGTAQIWDANLDGGKGGWKQDIYNYSFFGWVGTDSPDLSIGVVIYEGTPTKVAQGNLAMPIQSTQLFRRIAYDAVVTQKIPRNSGGPSAPSQKRAKSLG
jgi:stage V sporulation protein D (sporulation-specific penicillin-binding protein)